MFFDNVAHIIHATVADLDFVNAGVEQSSIVFFDNVAHSIHAAVADLNVTKAKQTVVVFNVL